MTGTRAITAASLALLAGLVAAAIALSGGGATGPVRPDAAQLRVGAGDPPGATAVLTYTAASGVAITADLALDGPADAASATLDVANALVEGEVDARVVGGVAYLDVTQFSSLLGAPWLSVELPRIHDGADAALAELRHPDLALLRRHGGVTTHHGATTTTRAYFARVRFPPLGSLPLDLPAMADVTLTVTTGAQGQVLEVTATAAGPGRQRAALVLTRYGRPAAIEAPAPDAVVPFDASRARDLFGTDVGAFDRLLGELGARIRVPGYRVRPGRRPT